MPSVSSGTVLVTGINGFAAMWIARVLLESGYSVKGTVRSAAKAAHPRKYFSKYGAKLEVVVVEDIAADGAFDAAVKDVDAIVHAAAAFDITVVEPSDIIGPAVGGTVGVLTSALKHGSRVKRVIQISSVSAVHNQDCTEPTVYTEEDWNEHVVELCNQKGRDASGSNKYEASKVLSERAAWKFMEDHKQALKFDLVSLNPGFILGPGLHECNDPMKLNTSLNMFYHGVPMGQYKDAMLVTPTVNWTDVLDFCQATVAAFRTEEAAGERFVVAAEQFTWQDWINVVRKYDPTIPAGNTSWKRADTKYTIYFDTSKVRQILGVNFRGWEECSRSVMNYYREKGWWGTK